MSKHRPPSSQREAVEGASGKVPVPVWLFVLLGLLGYWGMAYLDASAGGFHSRVYDPYPSLAYVEGLTPKSDADALFANGQRLYGLYCAVCHQATGQGIAGQNPPLAGSEWVQTETPSRIIRLVLSGIQGPITVKGQSYNGAMPPWRDLMSDDEIASVVTYIRANAAWGNSASPATPEQVKAIREETSMRTTAWAPDELLQVPLN